LRHLLRYYFANLPTCLPSLSWLIATPTFCRGAYQARTFVVATNCYSLPFFPTADFADCRPACHLLALGRQKL